MSNRHSRTAAHMELSSVMQGIPALTRYVQDQGEECLLTDNPFSGAQFPDRGGQLLYVRFRSPKAMVGIRSCDPTFTQAYF